MHPTESSPRSVSSAEVIQTILQLITARELAQNRAPLCRRLVADIRVGNRIILFFYSDFFGGRRLLNPVFQTIACHIIVQEQEIIEQKQSENADATPYQQPIWPFLFVT